MDLLQINGDFMAPAADLRSGGMGTTRNNAAGTGGKTADMMLNGANGVLGVEGMQKLNELI